MDRDYKLLLIGVLFTIVAFFIFFWLVSCDEETDGCEPEDARCIGSVLEICNADQNWETVVNCLDFEPGEWACCVRDGEIGCNLVEECNQ